MQWRYIAYLTPPLAPFSSLAIAKSCCLQRNIVQDNASLRVSKLRQTANKTTLRLVLTVHGLKAHHTDLQWSFKHFHATNRSFLNCWAMLCQNRLHGKGTACHVKGKTRLNIVQPVQCNQPARIQSAVALRTAAHLAQTKPI